MIRRPKWANTELKYSPRPTGLPDQWHGLSLSWGPPPATCPMSEHRIHLRKAWEIGAWDAPNSPATRIDLPLETPQAAAHICLRRAFQQPAIDPNLDCLALLLEQIPGLKSVQLNGNPLWSGLADDQTRLELPWLAEEPRRCILTLEVEQGLPQGWGTVAILIRERKV